MNYEFKNDNDLSNFQDKENYFQYKLNNRAKTAPPRPPNIVEEFRNSGIFNCIEKALSYLENFSHPYSQSFDMDSTDGQVFCRKFLQQLEQLQILAKVKTSSRQYRKQFSNAYRILYKENELCYLTEILDSAQESVPCLYVNGEKYCFTEEVIKIELQGVLRKGFLSNNYESNFLDIEDFENDLKNILEKFDSSWVAYENLYVQELMIIEAQARKYITQAIKYESQLTQLELEQQATQKFINPNSQKIQELKSKIIKLMGQINSVANMEGKGRDDLNYTILQSAEEILENYSVCESKSIRILAQNVVNSFDQFRKLLRKYKQNIEVVDPQLRNNPDLLQVLMSYESFWEKGKRYFLDKQKTSQLVFFSNVIEGLCEKHQIFQDKLEYCDTEIFIMIPMIMILRKINEEDKNICSYYLPELLENNSKYSTSLNKLISIFQSIKKKNFLNNKENCKSFLNTSYQNFQNQKKFKTLLKSRINSIKKSKILSNNLYNFFEKLIIAEEKDQLKIIKEMQYENVSSNITEALRIMRILSIEIQRKNPVEWNEFMDIALQHTLTSQLIQLQCQSHKMKFLKKLFQFLMKVVKINIVQALIVLTLYIKIMKKQKIQQLIYQKKYNKIIQ